MTVLLKTLVFNLIYNKNKHVYFYCRLIEKGKIESSKVRRGRPAGRSVKGEQTRSLLYAVALKMFDDHGYEDTTLRQIAQRAELSPGLLYRYFPNKRAIVLELYRQLSADYARQVTNMKEGSWRDRFLFALQTSLEVLGPHRATLCSIIPALISRGDEGLFSSKTRFAREPVQAAFVSAVKNSKDAPKQVQELGWILYLAHLAIILFWLLDRTENQQGTKKLLLMVTQARMLMGLAVSTPVFSKLIFHFARISQTALLEHTELVEV